MNASNGGKQFQLSGLQLSAIKHIGEKFFPFFQKSNQHIDSSKTFLDKYRHCVQWKTFLYGYNILAQVSFFSTNKSSWEHVHPPFQ